MVLGITKLCRNGIECKAYGESSPAKICQESSICVHYLTCFRFLWLATKEGNRYLVLTWSETTEQSHTREAACILDSACSNRGHNGDTKLRSPLFVLAGFTVELAGYVLSNSVPSHGFITSFCGNSTVLSVTNGKMCCPKTICSSSPSVFLVFWSALFVPRIAACLSKLKYKISSLETSDPPVAILFNKCVVQCSITFDVLTVVVAPMLSVFILDESCLRSDNVLVCISIKSWFRYYLAFSSELESLLDSWNLAQKGVAAYRSDFCSRKLTYQFAYGCHPLNSL